MTPRFTTHGQRPGGADQQVAQIGRPAMTPARRQQVHGPLQPMETPEQTRAWHRLFQLLEATSALAIVAGVIWLFAAMTPA